jgi:broad specificity phosphatase PhoE
VTRLHLVRHGRAAAGWGDDLDPGLDEVGRAQAEAMAGGLDGPLPIVTSPLRRCRETAAALARRWGVTVTVDPAVGEIRSPTDDLPERVAWLRGFMAGRWDDPGVGPELAGWRAGVVDALLALTTDAVVVTHFVAINVAVGAATGDPRAVCFRPDNCSITVLDHDGSRLRVVSLGDEAVTAVG